MVFSVRRLVVRTSMMIPADSPQEVRPSEAESTRFQSHHLSMADGNGWLHIAHENALSDSVGGRRTSMRLSITRPATTTF